MEKGIFVEKGAVFLGEGDFRGEKKDKRKAPDLSDAVAIFVVYDVLYSISTGLIPERIQLRF